MRKKNERDRGNFEELVLLTVGCRVVYIHPSGLTAFLDGFVAPVRTVPDFVAHFAHINAFPTAALEFLWTAALRHCRQTMKRPSKRALDVFRRQMSTFVKKKKKILLNRTWYFVQRFRKVKHLNARKSFSVITSATVRKHEPICMHVRFLQSTSSEPSVQSLMPLHCLLPGMQLPSSHLNWSGPQVRTAAETQTG